MSEEPSPAPEDSAAEDPAAEDTPPPASETAPAPASSPASGPPQGAEKKVLAGILGLVLGSLGIHKFILGYTKEGIIQIVLTIVTCGIAGIIGFIEGIIYLTKSDQEFVATYVQGRKGWF